VILFGAGDVSHPKCGSVGKLHPERKGMTRQNRRDSPCVDECLEGTLRLTRSDVTGHTTHAPQTRYARLTIGSAGKCARRCEFQFYQETASLGTQRVGDLVELAAGSSAARGIMLAQWRRIRSRKRANISLSALGDAVMAISTELGVGRRSLLEMLRESVGRDEFFAGLYIIGCANGLLGRILLSLNSGWAGILGSDISVFVWFACFAGISLISKERTEELRSVDLAVGMVFLVFVTLPIFALSWVAITGLSLFILFFANNGSARKRGAMIMLALTVPMLWSSLLFQLFARPILTIDASIASLILNTDRIGNVFGYADGSGHLVVYPGCSSFANLSLALLCWISITRWINHRQAASDILWSLSACASVVAVNITRISLMGLSHWHHNLIHNDWGNMVANYITLMLVMTFCMLGVRREIFSHA
jgi:hypothetical protein